MLSEFKYLFSSCVHHHGCREVTKPRGSDYKLIWKSEPDFVRLAAKCDALIVPFAAVGADDAFDVVMVRAYTLGLSFAAVHALCLMLYLSTEDACFYVCVRLKVHSCLVLHARTAKHHNKAWRKACTRACVSQQSQLSTSITRVTTLNASPITRAQCVKQSAFAA